MVGNIKLSNKLLLAELLKTVPDEKFYMHSFYDNYQEGISTSPAEILGMCKTTGCVAGYASTIWPELMRSQLWPNTDALAQKLGLTPKQERQLFFNYNATRQDQIDCLEKWAIDDRIS